ncbi:zinc finger FYVE domain-containing protein 1 isoform X4 [Rhinatrema bivittatum]|uniref:zinc finger FYVE domain-containing protein 1 isoform X4 n=1 Tax=Rhinatrema bivittatum TaxID=194408 RepID=UPI001125CA6C|nr:zinc finger FYVE domain-containing protein 1 isoform X4 [Rhinatrema bivittatum]
MSAQTPTVDKGLNTSLLCQESYVCGGTNEAIFDCDECSSLQCQRCEEELHKQERRRNHERIRIRPGHVPYCDSCKGANGSVIYGSTTDTRQRAAIRCQACKTNLCIDCQKRSHSGGNKRKHPVTTYHTHKTWEQQEGNGMDEETKRKVMTEKVVSFLLVDETEEIQVEDEEEFIKKLDCKPDDHLKELKATTARCGLDVPLSTLGPGVVIFHETMHTKLLGSEHPSEMPEKLIQERFRKLSRFPEAFSSIDYKGTRTYNPPTDFSGLRRTVEHHLENNTTRSPRHPGVIYKALKALSDRFSGEIPDDHMAHSCFFPDEYFTCSSVCLSCGAGCKNSMNHSKEGLPHEAQSRCRYSHQYDNRVFTCKTCYESGKEVNVIPKTSASSDSPWIGLAKYAWSGYVIECPNCGVIYRSRQYWFGNQDPVDTVVRTEIEHVWPGTDGFLKDNNNAAQRLLDGMNFMAQSVSELSIGPTKAVTSWLTDQIAPGYWRPNSQIMKCNKCGVIFKDNDTKHHCRACGEGFCDGCSSKTCPVPERGWGPSPVRVCDSCYDQKASQTDIDKSNEDEEGGTLIARKVGEAVQNTFGAVVTAIDIPLGLVKDAARPVYWVPDHEILLCYHCQREFNVKLSKHHCRACGQGFCDECSHDRRPVPSRGWDHPVRVCFSCNKKPGDL